MLENIDYEIERNKKLLKKWRNQDRYLKEYENMVMSSSAPQGRSPMFYLVNEDKSRTYLGRKQMELREDIQKGHMVKESIDQVVKNLKILNEFKKGFVPFTPETICGLVPNVYRNQPFAMQMLGFDSSIEEWKASLVAEREEYEYYRPYPDELKHKTSDGGMVRTKSETLVSEHLIARGIPYVYESPIWIGGKLIWTDFTTLNMRTSTVWRIEHVGMIDDAYNGNAMAKLNLYAHNGWVPYQNLLMTFDYDNGKIDMKSIGEILDYYLL